MAKNNRNNGKKALLKEIHEDKFIPLQSLDLSKISSFDELARGMASTAFGGRRLAEAVDVTSAMVRDKDCFKVITLSGAMTMAKMGLVICDMIDKGMVNAIVSTGALMCHGFVESVGKVHFKNPGDISDEELREMRLDRVYDTLESEENLDDVERIIDAVLESIEPDKPTCSYKICYLLGKYLNDNVEGRAILKSAYLKNVPVYIPAFTDSEIGLDFALFNRRNRIANKQQLLYDPFLDLDHYADSIFKAKKTGIFTIGGGVPRNWAQQVAPYLDIIQYRIVGRPNSSKYFSRIGKDPYVKPFWYGVRICPEPVHWGGLSGSTYTEGISWGKFVPTEKGGKFAEVLADATIAWPIIVKAVMERLIKNI